VQIISGVGFYARGDDSDADAMRTDARFACIDDTSASVSWDQDNASLVADFAAGNVDLTAPNTFNPVQVPAPFDRVEVRGMRIEGSVFAGGTQAIYDGATDVTDSVVGSALEPSDAVGRFFGPANAAPAAADAAVTFEGTGNRELSVTTLHSR
jgi:hypothetical protein